jgi:diapolycopene oxygenase
MFDAKNSFRASTLGDVLAMRMGRSVAGTIRSHVPDERVSQMLDHFTQYVGSSPLNVARRAVRHRAHADRRRRVVSHRRHARRAAGAGAAGGELGVEIRLNTGISASSREKAGRVTGVQTDYGETIASAPSCPTWTPSARTANCLAARWPTRFDRREYEPACSGVVLYLGLKERYEHIAHHNFVFSRDHDEEFDAIYERGEPAPDPTAYLCAPSQTEPAVAPPGGEALYVLVHTPYLRPRHDWERCSRLSPHDHREAQDAPAAWKTSKTASCANAR